MKFSAEQTQALTTVNGNYIVSASAGSGKTAVLTERVFRLLEGGVKLSELLILTFSNLAASQMRDKIREKLIASSLPNKYELIASLDAANIQTYDSYALSLVQKYHYLVGAHSDVQVIEKTIEEMLEADSIKKVLKEHYDAKDQRVLDLVSKYCVKNTESIEKFISQIIKKANLYVDKESFFKNYDNEFLNDAKYNELFDIYYQQFLDKLNECWLLMDTISYTDYLESFYEVVDQFRFEKTYDGIINGIVKYCELPDAPRGKLSEDEKAIKKFVCEFLNGIKKNPVLKDDLLKHAKESNGIISLYVELAHEVDLEMDSFKKKNNLYSFADIAKLATKVVLNKDVNQEIRNSYKYIMIDEYQDTSNLQEDFINLISNNNVYVVGDVKQSIYGFRNANCQIFLDKKQKYEKNNGGTAIAMTNNYRSRKEVLADVNRLFDVVMNKKDSGIDYTKGHRMVYGNTSFDVECVAKQPKGLKQAVYSAPDDIEARKYEAYLIASDIKNKIESGFQVVDDDTKKLRPCEYRDFAIITSTKGEYEKYKRVFGEYKIPLYINREKNLANYHLTLILQNIIYLLTAVGTEEEQSTKFAHRFISVYRSFLFEHDDNQIYNIAKNKNYCDFAPYKPLVYTKNEIDDKTLPEAIEIIIQNFKFYDRLPLLGDIADNIGILEYFHSISVQLEKLHYSITDFSNYFDDIKSLDIEPEASEYDDTSNSAKLLTIFASKGLQYKVCYFPEFDKGFNFTDIHSTSIIDLKYGVRVPHVCGDKKDFVHSIIQHDQKLEVIRERLRILYVALTRTSELGIILINSKESSKFTIFQNISSMLKFYQYTGVKFEDYPMDLNNQISPAIPGQNSKKYYEILDNIPMDKTLIETSRASKKSDDTINEELLLLGNKYHYYLELLDFKTKDTSFIKDAKDKSRIDKFISSPVFKDITKAQVAHEYPFYDVVNKVHGIIDLLVRYDDHIDIIDFKLSHVSDEAYEKQVGVYEAYIKQISNLPVHTYVTGILSGEIKQVS